MLSCVEKENDAQTEPLIPGSARNLISTYSPDEIPATLEMTIRMDEHIAYPIFNRRISILRDHRHPRRQRAQQFVAYGSGRLSDFIDRQRRAP